MKKRQSNWIILTLAVLLATACSAGNTTPTPETIFVVITNTPGPTEVADPQDTSPTETPDAPEPTPTIADTATPELPTPTPTAIPATATHTATPSPLCNVVSAVNLRFGPGLSYDPPIRALTQGTEALPLAFSAVGYPTGQWLQIQVVETNEIGWVSSLADYIACNIDIITLPPPTNVPATPTPVPPTPTPTPSSLIARLPGLSDDLGNCNEPLQCELLAPPNAFVQVRVFDTTAGSQDGAGISHVEFEVTDSKGNLVHERTERQAGYCIFGGGEPTCNPWRQDNGVYKWPDGTPVREGEKYFVNILAYRKGEEDFFDANWSFEASFDVP